MSTHYCQGDDLKRIKDLKVAAPAEFEAWLNLDKIVGKTDGKIPVKYRELIALAVAHTTQCAYCIDVHVKGAKKAGATKEEVAESVFLAAAIRAGGAAAHGAMAMRLFDEAP